RLTAVRQTLVDRARPRVVTQHHPGAFDQELAQRLRPPLGDPAAMIGVGRLVLSGHDAAVGRYLLGGPEPLGLRQESNDRLGRPWADAGDSFEDLYPLIHLG